MKKKFNIWLALFAALALIFAVGCDTSGDDDNSSGTSSSINWNNEEADANGNWWVTTEDGLKNWAADVNTNGNNSANCTLGEDITLTSEWNPVGDNANRYIGTFDGNGKTISSFSITDSERQFTGFLGYVGSGGTVKNLTLNQPTITDINNVYSYSAGIAAISYGTIENCTVSGGTISASGGGYGTWIGGIVAMNEGAVIRCENSAAISGTAVAPTYAGGIAGQSSTDSSVVNCTNSGSVTVSTANSSTCAGGIVGVSYIMVSNCSNTGEIRGSNSGDIYGKQEE